MGTLENVKSAYELERGKPIPTFTHAVLQRKILLYIELNYANRFFALPELNLLINQEKLVPDLAVYEGQEPLLTEQDSLYAPTLPAITVEIISPSQHIVELTDKAERYLRAGVQSCWIVLPEFKSVVLTSVPGDYTTFDRRTALTDPTTGIKLDLAKLFA